MSPLRSSVRLTSRHLLTYLNYTQFGRRRSLDRQLQCSQSQYTTKHIEELNLPATLKSVTSYNTDSTGSRCWSAFTSIWLCSSTEVTTRQMAPSYLADQCHHQSSDTEASQCLCSTSSSLVVRCTRLSTIGDRAFPVADSR